MYPNNYLPSSYRYIPLTGGLFFSLVGFLVGALTFYAYWCGVIPRALIAGNQQLGLLVAFLSIPVSTSVFALGGIAIAFIYTKNLKKNYRRNISK